MKSRKDSAPVLCTLAARWDWALVFFITPAALILTSLIVNYIIDPFDEGIQYLSYPLYKAGKIPYVDFYPLFPPIWTYANIVIEKIFGEYLLVQRLWFVVQADVVVLACYALCKKVYSKRLAALVVIAMIIVFGFHPYWLPRWSGARLAVYIGILLFYIWHVEKSAEGAHARLFILGALTGLTNLYALDVGIHITAVNAAMIVISFFSIERKDLRKNAFRLFAALGGFLLPLLLWCAYLAYNDALYSYISTYYYVYMFQFMPISAKIFSAGELNFHDLKVIILLIFLILLGAGLLYTVIYNGFIKKNLYGRRRALTFAMLLSFAVSVSTLRGLHGPQYQMFALIPVLLWGGLAAVRLASYIGMITSRDRPQSPSAPLAVVLQIAILIPLALLSYSLNPRDTINKIAVIQSNIKTLRLLSNGDEWAGVYSSTVPQLAYTADKHLDYLINYLSAHTAPNEAVLAFPFYVEIIPALAKRHHSTSYPVPILLMGSPKRQLEYIKEIDKERPRYAVFFPSAKYGGIEPVAPYFRAVYKYITAHYEPVKDLHQGKKEQLWVRKDR